MISIICSTQKPDESFKSHILKSCGINKAEFIFYENPGIMSLTQVYQKGLKEAKYDIVVFLHDDLHFQTDAWGRKLKKLFDESDYGIIGLAGTTDLVEEGTWWKEKTKMIGIVRHTDGKKTWENKYSGAFPKQIIQTVNVDGLFIAVNRKRIKYEFDTTIPGFHFYDLDFSFGNHVNGVKVGVTTDIRVIHRGLGETNQEWEENRKVFAEKFKDNLPASIVPDIVVDPIDIKPNKSPKVVIVIDGKDPDKIKSCIDNLREKTKYTNYRIIVSYSDYNDVKIGIEGVEVFETSSDNFSSNSNKIVEDLIKDDEIVVFMSENSIILNDVISLGVKTMINTKNCGTITARVHSTNNMVYNCGYEIWNIVQPSAKEGEQPKSSLLVNLNGNGSYYTFRNENIFDTVGGSKEFLMVGVDHLRKIKFNDGYKKIFQDLELNLRLIFLGKTNIVLGNGVIQLKEDAPVDEIYNDDLTKVFLPYIYSQELNKIAKYIKTYAIPKQQ
jgi:hypothetical protein